MSNSQLEISEMFHSPTVLIILCMVYTQFLQQLIALYFTWHLQKSNKTSFTCLCAQCSDETLVSHVCIPI